MGVRCLETYLEKINKAACYKVKVKDLIHEFRHDNKTTPIIVIDGISTVMTLYSCDFSWLRGGQVKEFEKFLVSFINFFKNEGARLVFFFDGPHASFKRETWAKRCLDSVKSLYEFFDMLKNGFSAVLLDSCGILPGNMYFMTMVVAAENGCEVFTTVRDGDVEIAEYAFKNNCMAVLAQDTDFVIFKHAKYYLSLKNFDFSDMTTLVYDREIFASSIGLPSCQLPLLASLVGNDFISSEKLVPFHKKLLADRVKYCEKWFHIGKLILQVARFIQRRVHLDDFRPQVLEQIADEVFQEKSKWELLELSISYYNFSSELNKNPGCPASHDEKWGTILRKACELQRTKFVFQYVYGIIAYKHYSCPLIMEDFRMNDLPAAMIVLRPLRQKLYGVLMYENPEDCEIEEWVMSSPDSLEKGVLVKPEKPNVEHPGLLSLWGGETKEHWSLIADIFEVDSFKMRSLPTHLMLPALALRYLNNNVKIFKWELSALVSSVVLLQFYGAEDLELVPISNVMRNTRPLRLYTLVTKCYSTVILIFCSFGETIPFKMMSPSNFQNGKLFHLKYRLASQNCGVEALCEEEIVAIDYYERMMRFITETKKSLF